MGIERNADLDGETWEGCEVTHSQQGGKGKGITYIIEGAGLKLQATQTSDGGYKDDGTGITTSEGEMVLFDLDPNKSSWEKEQSRLPSWSRCSCFTSWICSREGGEKEQIGANGNWKERPNQRCEGEVI